MNANIVETLSRHAAQSVSRRGSLLTLSSALAATVAAPSLALAGNSRKKGKRKTKNKKNASQDAEKQANQVCESQVAGCQTALLAACNGTPGQCFAASQCCSSLSVCNTTGFFDCLVSSFA